MQKEWKQILCILVFIFVGAVLGYVVAATQHAQLSDPEYIQFWTAQNVLVPEPMTFTQGILSFSFLLSGIPTGAMLYRHFAGKWLTSSAPKIIIAIVTFPINTLIGVICALPVIVYKLCVLVNSKQGDS